MMRHSPLTIARRGLSLVDTMISLSITGLLLAAVAASYSASSSAVQNNDEFFRASNAARVSILQVMSAVRRCQALQVSSDRIDMITAEGQDRSYKFEPGASGATGRLVLIDNSTGNSYTLASDITSLSFSSDTKMVTMSISVDIGANQTTLGGSAMQRRLVTYD